MLNTLTCPAGLRSPTSSVPVFVVSGFVVSGCMDELIGQSCAIRHEDEGDAFRLDGAVSPWQKFSSPGIAGENACSRLVNRWFYRPTGCCCWFSKTGWK